MTPFWKGVLPLWRITSTWMSWNTLGQRYWKEKNISFDVVFLIRPDMFVHRLPNWTWWKTLDSTFRWWPTCGPDFFWVMPGSAANYVLNSYKLIFKEHGMCSTSKCCEYKIENPVLSYIFPRYWSARLGLKLVANDPMAGLPLTAAGGLKSKQKSNSTKVGNTCPFVRVRDLRIYA